MNEEQEFLKNFGLVISQATKFKPGILCDKDDYIQAGSIGLLRALRKWNSALGPLSTFAYESIKNEILQEIKKDKKGVRHICFEPSYELINKINEYVPQLTDQQHEILIFRLQGHTYAEIARNFNKSKEWARSELLSIIEIIRKANEEKNIVQK